MNPLPISRRSLLVALAAVFSPLSGCRRGLQQPQQAWVRENYSQCGIVAVPTMILPPLGAGPPDLRREFQQCLSAQLRKSKCRQIVEREAALESIAWDCTNDSTNWDLQLEGIGSTSAIQAVVSRITYLQTTAPIKLALHVEAKDIGTRETLRQVEGLWDAEDCASCPPSRTCVSRRVAEPKWEVDLNLISPRHLLEQAAREVARKLDGADSLGPMQDSCAGSGTAT